MKKIHKNVHVLVLSCKFHKSIHFHINSAYFCPPLHHNGKRSIMSEAKKYPPTLYICTQ